MMIIRGVNVFPSQIETVLLKCGYTPNYQILVDRIGNEDTFDINVELSEEQFKEALMGKPKRSRWKTALITIVIVALLGVLAFELLLGVTKMRDEAMGTSVPEGSRILYSRLSKLPHTNELAVFENKGGLLCVRRAIARGGDTVDYDEISNEILVNNKAIPNVPSDVSWRGMEDVFEFPITVQEGEVFVLASNRSKATNEGLIKTDQIKGTVLKIF